VKICIDSWVYKDMNQIKNFFNELPNLIMDDAKRSKIQFLGVYGLLGSVALFMTILNIITRKGALTYATGIFALLMAINIFCELKGGKASKTASIIFQIELISLFSFFLFSGNPEGFSSLWVMLLPSCGMMLFKTKNGSILCGTMFLILIFCFWTPFGKSLLHYNYNATFMMRFPILFAAFYLLALALETISQTAFNNFQFMSKHDALTGAYNRRGFSEEVAAHLKNGNIDKAGFLIADLDLFKNVNDNYGHFAGDEVLTSTANLLKEFSGLDVCRWGGEEYAIFDPKGTITQEKLSEIVKKFEEHKIIFKEQEIPITISIGAVVADPRKYNIDQISKLADKCLYEAKANGRNQAVFKELI